MACYLLTWNPERWDWETLDEERRAVSLGRPVPRRWSAGKTKRIKTGDRLFLLKQGVEPRGLMASGFATADVKEDSHWDSERRAHGETSLFTMVEFDRIVDPDSVLPLEQLTTGPLAQMHWHPAASGIEVPAELCPELERLWEAFVPRRTSQAAEELTPGVRYPEGDAEVVLVNRHERSSKARQQCIAAHGTRCAVCGFSFEERYGSIGQGYIHVHHLFPLHSEGPREIVPERDLRPVCPNCHAMLHQRNPPFDIEELRDHLK